MKNVLFSTGQRIIKQIIDWIQDSKDTSILERHTDFVDFGILQNKLNTFDIIAGTNNTPLTPSVTVRTGVAFDVNGERVIVDDETISYDPSAPSHTTDNGGGVFISTPRSTGSKNIPLTTNSLNYLWIDYLETVDDTFFTIQKITNLKQFYKQTDGYTITVTTINTPPSFTSLFLGSIDLTGFGVVSVGTISKVGRSSAAITIDRVKIHTPQASLVDRTTSYPYDTDLFLDNHIKAVGSGAVTATNPHGTSLTDIGLSTTDTVPNHQKFFHSNGIAGDSSSIISSLYSFVTTVNPGSDFLTTRPLAANEEVIVDGETITSVDLPSDTTLIFTGSDPSGIWYIYLDKASKSILKTQTNLISSPDTTKLLLYTVVWTYVGVGPFDHNTLTVLTDYRVFGNIATREIQDSAVTTSKLNDSSVTEFKLNISVAGAGLSGGAGTPLAVNVDGTSIEINSDTLRIASGAAGDGLAWSTGVLSVNVDNSTIEINTDTLRVKDNGITEFKLNTSVAGNGLSGGGGSPLAVNVDGLTIGIISDTLQAIPSSRHPILVYISASLVDIENNTGTANQTSILFPDGNLRTVTEDTSSTNKYRRFDITATANFTSGTEDSGLRSGLSEAANTWYAIYAVKSQINAVNFVLAGDTTLPLESNFSTLNARYGTNSWVYIAMIRNGYGAIGSTTDIVSFQQSGPFFTLGAADGNIFGITLVNDTSSPVSLSYFRTNGTGATDIPNQILFGQMTLWFTSGTASIAFDLDVHANGGPSIFRDVVTSFGNEFVLTVSTPFNSTTFVTTNLTDGGRQGNMSIFSYMDGILAAGPLAPQL